MKARPFQTPPRVLSTSTNAISGNGNKVTASPIRTRSRTIAAPTGSRGHGGTADRVHAVMVTGAARGHNSTAPGPTRRADGAGLRLRW